MENALTSRERLETAWNFEEPDRVPIEMSISKEAAADPRAAKLVELIRQHSDYFYGWSPPWGYFGLENTYEEEVIDEKPGEYVRRKRTYHTPAGDFTAQTYHPTSTKDPNDYAWEKHYLSSPDDLRRILDAPCKPLPIDFDAYTRTLEKIGDKGILLVGFPQPFGDLARNTLRQDFYMWLVTERELMHQFLDEFTDRIYRQLERIFARLKPRYFSQCGMEMAITPWISRPMFEEYITPTDGRLYGLIRRHGGKTRIHCHGCAMEYLERFHEIGIDGIEPCEPPPQGDVVLAEAKKRVGDRMLLCGNITSPQFEFMDPDETEEMVKAAIRDGAPGGGFVLRTTGGLGGTGCAGNLGRVLANCQRMMEAGVKYGRYPIRV
ncbi:MAG: uroporphyrinogen decarboxylase family protein [Planctomycetota bacterium]